MKRIPTKKLNAVLEKNAFRLIFQEIKKIDSLENLTSFIEKYFTEKEKGLILRRAAVGILLKDNKSYRRIRDMLEISQGTVSNVRDLLDGRGYGRNPKRKRIYSTSFVKKQSYSKSKKLFPKYKGAESII